jgi:2-hydroxy-3-keto-5-methylthiopentenyl-1-phosphate phosphatase
MGRRIGVFVDYEQTLVDVAYFYLFNPDIFIKNIVYSVANFLKYAFRYRNTDLLYLIYYFLLEEDKRSGEILKRMKKRTYLYADENLLDLIVKLSENRSYDVKIVSSSSEKIIRGFLSELERKYGRKINIEIIASSQYRLVTSKTKGEIAKNYEGPKICFADGPNDVEFSKNCDLTIVKNSLFYYISPKKPIGYIPGRKKFKEIVELLKEKLTSNNFHQ